MGKIKIKGYPELIDVSDDEARTTRAKMQSGEYTKDSEAQIGMYFGKIGNIGAIFVGEEQRPQDEQYKARLRTYYDGRRELLALGPRERAEKSGWGHFSLFHWMATGQNPPIEMKEKILGIVADFYEKNSAWSKPSLKLWLEMPEYQSRTATGDYRVAGLRLLESIHKSERQSIESDRNFASSSVGGDLGILAGVPA